MTTIEIVHRLSGKVAKSIDVTGWHADSITDMETEALRNYSIEHFTRVVESA